MFDDTISFSTFIATFERRGMARYPGPSISSAILETFYNKKIAKKRLLEHKYTFSGFPELPVRVLLLEISESYPGTYWRQSVCFLFPQSELN